MIDEIRSILTKLGEDPTRDGLMISGRDDATVLAAALAWRWRSSPAGRQALVVALVGATFEAAIALRAVFA